MSRTVAALLLIGLAAAASAGEIDTARLEADRAFLNSTELWSLDEETRSAVIASFIAARLEALGFEGASPDGGMIWRHEVPRARFPDDISLSVVGVGALEPGRDFSGSWRGVGAAKGCVVHFDAHLAAGDLRGKVALVFEDEGGDGWVKRAVKAAEAKGAAAVLLGRPPRDIVTFADGRTERGEVEDRGTEFLFRPLDGPQRILTKEDVSSVQFDVLMSPGMEGWGGTAPKPIVSIPVLHISSALVKGFMADEGCWVELDTRLDRITANFSYVVARWPGTGETRGRIALEAWSTRPDQIAVALAVAQAAAAGEPRVHDLEVAFTRARPVTFPFMRVVIFQRNLAGLAEAADRLIAELEIARDGPIEGVGARKLTLKEPESSLAGAIGERAAGRHDRALAAVDGALAESPENLRLLLARGRILIARGDLEQVARAAEALDRLAAGQGWGDLLRADAAFSASDEPAGATALSLAAEAGLPEALLLRAYRVGLTPEAGNDLRSAVSRGGESAAALCARGVLLLSLGRTDDAREFLDRSIATDPGLAVARAWRGRMLTDLDAEHELALADLARAERLGLNDPALWFSRGLIELRLGRHEAAIQTFRDYLAMSPDSPAAVYNIACGYALMGEREAALDWLGRAVDAGFARRPEDAAHARLDPDLASIRDDPRFERILKSAETE